MMDPNVGRWTSEDPIWPDDHINPYVYVGNNPTNRTDPTGLQAVDPANKILQPGQQVQVLMRDGTVRSVVIAKDWPDPLARIRQLYPGGIVLGIDDGPLMQDPRLRPHRPAITPDEKRKEVEQQREAQERVRVRIIGDLTLGIPEEKLTDPAGPDVTDWFAQDILAHIKHRKETLDFHKRGRELAKATGIPGLETGIEGGAFLVDSIPVKPLLWEKGYMYQAKYLMGPKWIDFGGPDNGKGVNTVILQGKVLRKNQLGNIEFGVISILMPPIGFSGDGAVETAYKKLDPVRTYDPTHPGAERYRRYAGYMRADNLAAFGVGARIAEKIMELDSWKSDKVPTLEEIKKILKEVFTEEELKKAVARYSHLYEDGKNQIRPGALTTIEYFGGFNANGLDQSKSDLYKGTQSSIDHFKTLIIPEYEKYKERAKANSEDALDLDTWLRTHKERYWLSR